MSFPLHSPAAALVVWLVVGRCWASTSRPCDGKLSRPIAIVVALAFVPFGLWLGLQELRSQSSLRDAIVALGTRNCVSVLAATEQVRRHAPWRRRDAGIAAMAVFECEKDPAVSLVALESALANHPHQINLLLAVGARRLKSGDATRAADAFGHAVEIVPSLGPAWVGLAMSRSALGDRAAAALACDTALEVAPHFRPAVDYCSGFKRSERQRIPVD